MHQNIAAAFQSRVPGTFVPPIHCMVPTLLASYLLHPTLITVVNGYFSNTNSTSSPQSLATVLCGKLLFGLMFFILHTWGKCSSGSRPVVPQGLWFSLQFHVKVSLSKIDILRCQDDLKGAI